MGVSSWGERASNGPRQVDVFVHTWTRMLWYLQLDAPSAVDGEYIPSAVIGRRWLRPAQRAYPSASCVVSSQIGLVFVPFNPLLTDREYDAKSESSPCLVGRYMMQAFVMLSFLCLPSSGEPSASPRVWSADVWRSCPTTRLSTNRMARPLIEDMIDLN